ncbi:MAG: nuclear transport factor 2 family protein [Tepidimonas sp.]|uniref:nuclear transport factor 2 family protein n=1 Tax=Tepidimonas sp. TaxID=2002775 RepID=UPI00259F4FE4|nr:nuclear transport factor 2 family protein [Tepidimonas sp.]MDM7457418.1 nuclear transport factor 2 family protein [Tepidimonas sp.]
MEDTPSYGTAVPLSELSADPLARVEQFFRTLTPASLSALDRVYTEDAWFKDPFHEVQGVSAIRAIFEHMYLRLDGPHFVVRDLLGDAHQGFVTWDFVYRFRGEARDRCIRGSTHLRFAPDGRVRVHRDYWDAAQELYEQLPVLGGLMRWLRRRAAAPIGH